MTKENVQSLVVTRGRFCSVNWKIPTGFWREEGECWESPTFYFSNATWYLSLCTGEERDHCNYPVSFYLVKQKPQNLIHRTQFTLGLKGTDGTVYKSCTFTHVFKAERFGSSEFLMTNQFQNDESKIAVSGEMTFCCEVNILYSCVNKESEAYLDDDIDVLNKNIADLFVEGKNSDITVKVRDREFRAHKSILMANSPVFASMFDHSTEESKSGIFSVPGYDPDVFHDFLKYLYIADIDEFSTEKAVSLYPIAHKYGVKQLMQKCVKFMKTNCSVDTFCDVLALALTYDLTTLIEVAEKFFAENATDILVTCKWQSFHEENSHVANELFIKCLKQLEI